MSRVAPGAALAVATIVVATLLATTGCERWRLEREAAATVRRYNEALIVAYRTNDPRGLDAVVGQDELRRLVALIDLKRNASLALEGELQALEVLATTLAGPDAMTVRTRERWRYRDRALKPGMPVGPVFLADLWMSWELGRERGVWKVQRGRTLRSEYLEPKGYRPAGSSTSPGGRPTPGPATGGSAS